MKKVKLGMELIAPENCKCSYLTPGKKYTVVGLFGTNAFNIVDDEGDLLTCVLKKCLHLGLLDWIIVKKEKKEKPKQEEGITRVEVITDLGRVYVNWDERNKIRLDYQDEGRTLKVFITRK